MNATQYLRSKFVVAGFIFSLASIGLMLPAITQGADSAIAQNFKNMRLFTAERQPGGYLMTVHACQDPEAKHFVSDADFALMKAGAFTNSDNHSLETFTCGDSAISAELAFPASPRSPPR